MERTVTYFKKPGKEHTEQTLRLAIKAAKEREIDTIIVASTTGETALKSMELFQDSGLNLIVVTHQWGWRAPGVQKMPEKTKKTLENAGIKVVTSTDVLAGGVEKGISRQRPEKRESIEESLPFIVPPVTGIIDSVFHLFSNGVKVCVEISMMAADTGAIKVGTQVISVAGTHIGSDTALVITPSTSNRIKDLQINEILAKPLARE